MSTPSEMPSTPAPLPAAGWYQDPDNERLLRRWTGFAWTDETTIRSAIPRRVGFGGAIALAFKGTFTYKGRSTAPEFWWFFLFNVLVTMALYFLTIISTPTDPYERAMGNTGAGPFFAFLIFVWFVVSFVVQLPLIVRRLHDKDMTGWLALLIPIPIGSLVLLILLIGPGTPGPNRYGPVPTAMPVT